MQFQSSKKMISVFIEMLAFALILVISGCIQEPQTFTDDNVVAQFVHGAITTDQLTAYVSKIGPKCHTPAMGCHESEASGCSSDKSCDMPDSEMIGEADISLPAGGQAAAPASTAESMPAAAVDRKQRSRSRPARSTKAAVCSTMI